MEFLQGLHLDEWLTQNPTQEEKNHYAQQLWDFFVYFFITKNTLYADPNPGNYLFMKDGKLGVLDFGCIKKCDAEFPNQITEIIQHYIQKDMESVMKIYNEWGLLSQTLKDNNKQVESYISFFSEWLTLPFNPNNAVELG